MISLPSCAFVISTVILEPTHPHVVTSIRPHKVCVDVTSSKFTATSMSHPQSSHPLDVTSLKFTSTSMSRPVSSRPLDVMSLKFMSTSMSRPRSSRPHRCNVLKVHVPISSHPCTSCPPSCHQCQVPPLLVDDDRSLLQRLLAEHPDEVSAKSCRSETVLYFKELASETVQREST